MLSCESSERREQDGKLYVDKRFSFFFYFTESHSYGTRNAPSSVMSTKQIYYIARGRLGQETAGSLPDPHVLWMWKRGMNHRKREKKGKWTVCIYLYLTQSKGGLFMKYVSSHPSLKRKEKRSWIQYPTSHTLVFPPWLKDSCDESKWAPLSTSTMEMCRLIKLINHYSTRNRFFFFFVLFRFFDRFFFTLLL